MEIRITPTANPGAVRRAYPGRDGSFTIHGLRLTAHDVSLDVEGFAPIRQHIERGAFAGGAATIILLLQPAEVVRREGTGLREGADPNVVDLSRLAVEIPDDAEREYERAIDEAADGNHEAAVEHLERAVAIAPEFHEALNNLGVQYQHTGRPGDAITAFERAVALDPNDSLSRINLGSLYLARGEASGESERVAADAFGRALELLEQAVRTAPLSAPARYYLGTALYRTGAFEEAHAALTRAVELDRELREARLMLVNVCTRLGRYDAALEQIDEFLERYPDAPQRQVLEDVRKQIGNVLK